MRAPDVDGAVGPVLVLGQAGVVWVRQLVPGERAVPEDGHVVPVIPVVIGQGPVHHRIPRDVVPSIMCMLCVSFEPKYFYTTQEKIFE